MHKFYRAAEKKSRHEVCSKYKEHKHVSEIQACLNATVNPCKSYKSNIMEL